MDEIHFEVAIRGTHQIGNKDSSTCSSKGRSIVKTMVLKISAYEVEIDEREGAIATETLQDVLLKDLNRLQPNDVIATRTPSNLMKFRVRYQPQIEALLTADGPESEIAEDQMDPNVLMMWYVVFYQDTIPIRNSK